MEKQKLYYIVYKTTNLANGKTYVGKHITTDLNDKYLGSGTLLQKAIQKYGVHNFKREILFIFDNEVDMLAKEREIVNESFIKDTSNYNLVVGGGGTYDRNHGNIGTNDTFRKLNTSPWIWKCNPYLNKKTRSWNLELTDEEKRQGWEYGALGRANKTFITYQQQEMSLASFARLNKLDQNLALARYDANWTIQEILTISENLQLYKSIEEKELATIDRNRKISEKVKQTFKQKHDNKEKQDLELATRCFAEYKQFGAEAFREKYSNKKERRHIYALFRRYINGYLPQVKSTQCGKPIMIEFNGQTKSRSKWVNELNLTWSAVNSLKDIGMSYQDIFSALSNHPKKKTSKTVLTQNEVVRKLLAENAAQKAAMTGPRAG